MAATTPERAGDLASGVFGPTVAGGKPRNGGVDWLRFGMLVVSVVTAFAVFTGGYYAFILWRAQQNIGDLDLVINTEGGTSGFSAGDDADAPLELPSIEDLEDRTTILLVGSDSREGLSQEQLQAIGTDNTGTDLTDTIILLQIDPNTDAAAMLSFPRDLLVERCDGSTGRINQAFYIGEQQGEGRGAQCLIDTITALTRIHIDHYARVNFAGFVQAVDALGGVTFYIDEPLQDRYSGLDIPSGCVEFDGVTAIQFVRARRLDSDFGRIARQQRFAREMVNKATSVGTLLNPARVTSLVSSVSDSLETDRGFGAGQMIDLLNSVRGISSGAVDGRTVPGYNSKWGEADVVRLLEDEADALFRAFREGDLLPEGVGTDGGVIELGPSNVIPVRVLNGEAPEGTGQETADVLETLGFTVAEIGNAPNYGFTNSQILYPEGRLDHAELLAEQLGGVMVSPSADDVDELQLLLGSGFDPADFAPEPDPTESVSETPAATEAPGEDASEEVFAGAELSDIEC